MPLLPYRGIAPRLGRDVWIVPNAYLIGDVELGDEANVWFGTVIRGDTNRVVLGRGVNIQDNCTLHTNRAHPLIVGDEVAFGHNVIAHGCTIEPHVLLAIGSVVLAGAVIGTGSIVGARALVPEGMVVPPRSLVLGVPGKVVRAVTDADYERFIVKTQRDYLELAREYRAAGI